MFVVATMACYGVSSQYHRRNWSEHQERFMERLDLASIFVMIAFNSTPVFVLLVPGPGVPVLICMTICCLVGSIRSMENHHAFDGRWGLTSLYLAMGFGVAGFVVPSFLAEANQLEIACWAVGALCYAVGAAVYASKKPVLWPMVFGYHELFHALTLVSGALTYVTNYSVVARKQ